MMANVPKKVYELISAGETLTTEFKSDTKGLSDRDLVAAVVALGTPDKLRFIKFRLNFF